MANEKGRKEIDIIYNGQKGKILLVADLSAVTIENIINNTVHLQLGKPVDFNSAIDRVEFTIQMAQKLIKSAPFDINRPDNIRDLDPEVWQEIQQFIGQYYAPAGFLSANIFLIFGPSLLEQNSPSETSSTITVENS